MGVSGFGYESCLEKLRKQLRTVLMCIIRISLLGISAQMSCGHSDFAPSTPQISASHYRNRSARTHSSRRHRPLSIARV
ncbi:hypothetical protein Y032_0063g3472 [Ancylostoma ceylanicum]|uniref:Uncharacterized protein n=1 Tax=Ancylostoma ceylanicum TaxID=53326 RepID=A0A016U1N2_9BILA|nr:hypothetical protein Y032_0063g3472 [Ancylostoma ceylanicum]